MRYLILLVLLAGCGRDESAIAPAVSPTPLPSKPAVFVCPAGAVKECKLISCRCWDQAQGKYVPGAWEPEE